MSPQAGWILQEEVVPRLRAAIPRSVRGVGSEDTEELVQDSIAIAAKMLHSAEAAGKTVTSGNIVFYTVQSMKSGRRANGASNSDALGTATQLNGRSTINSLEETVAEDENGNEIFQIHDVLSQDQEDPAVKAARKMDWESFLSGLNQREMAVIKYLLMGRNMGEVAVMFKVCLSTIQACKNGLAARILDYMGPDILKEIRKLPGWKNSLNASRERLACRYERLRN
jgi:DNA-binding NarL/FixJ family response regulator